MDIIIYSICCYLNYKQAKQANLSGGKYAFYTFLGIIAGLFAGSLLILNFLPTNDPQFREVMRSVMQKPIDMERALYIQEKIGFLNKLIFFFSGIGGYLFVRYLLHKKIDTDNSQKI